MAEVVRINDDTYRIEDGMVHSLSKRILYQSLLKVQVRFYPAKPRVRKWKYSVRRFLKYDFDYAGFLGELRE